MDFHHAQALRIVRSFRHWLGYDLLGPGLPEEDVARALFEAPFAQVSHGTEADPVLNYGNRTALGLWEVDFQTLTSMPSRLTAEPMERGERARMLEQVSARGYIDDYAGVRISHSGRRFRIENAIVWNLIEEDGSPAGQAAMFREWRFVDPA